MNKGSTIRNLFELDIEKVIFILNVSICYRS
jgi:hypothetical protein